jgi:pimeloyl-ACP methyl ester carboxylesterase
MGATGDAHVGTDGQATLSHTPEIRRAYERVLAGSAVRSRSVATASGRVHVLEKGDGAPVVLLHPTGNPAGFFKPLLDELDGVRLIAPDRPGVGLSDPVDLPWHAYRETTVRWLDQLFDALELDTFALVGHSGGGVCALWYALAHRERVRRLTLIGTPTLPGTRCPLPVRLIGTPGLGTLLPRLSPPSRKSVLRLAQFLGEKETLASHPEVLDLLVAAGRDPGTDRATMAEFRALVSPFALASPSGWRRRSRVRSDELRALPTPTLVLWGDHDPVGAPAVAQAIAELMPHGTVAVMPAGHAPYLGQPARVADTLTAFIR